MSNAQKMTLEERVVQAIKEDHLMKLVGDEDAITDLAQRAIKEALYQPRRVSESFGRFEEKDSPVIQAARETAEKACREASEKLMAHLLEDAEFKDKVRDALAACLPSIMLQGFRLSVEGMTHDAAREATNDLRAEIQRGSFR